MHTLRERENTLLTHTGDVENYCNMFLRVLLRN
ncbi:hypothetical protein T11_18400 [Trichinella zimbabwensis]|uniref:Uncharacterized protein n=1 Tax=Trichinella zimbabwensis TaxID=268475 RepID=A0A0V1GCF2_9BILA|nr:hypothetical protein T11_18400 [Trichinella zimbabwensis]